MDTFLVPTSNADVDPVIKAFVKKLITAMTAILPARIKLVITLVASGKLSPGKAAHIILGMVIHIILRAVNISPKNQDADDELLFPDLKNYIIANIGGDGGQLLNSDDDDEGLSSSSVNLDPKVKAFVKTLIAAMGHMLPIAILPVLMAVAKEKISPSNATRTILRIVIHVIIEVARLQSPFIMLTSDEEDGEFVSSDVKQFLNNEDED